MDVPTDLILKVCVFGEAAVGKTSLIRRRVDGKFAPRYLPRGQAGVEVDTVKLGNNRAARLVLWDILQPEGMAAIRSPYMIGMHGYLLVCDATRRPTLTSARAMQHQLASQCGPLPFCLLINKADLNTSVEISPQDLSTVKEAGWPVHTTSAKNGHGVDQAFLHLAQLLAHESRS